VHILGDFFSQNHLVTLIQVPHYMHFDEKLWWYTFWGISFNKIIWSPWSRVHIICILTKNLCWDTFWAIFLTKLSVHPAEDSRFQVDKNCVGTHFGRFRFTKSSGHPAPGSTLFAFSISRSVRVALNQESFEHAWKKIGHISFLGLGRNCELLATQKWWFDYKAKVLYFNWQMEMYKINQLPKKTCHNNYIQYQIKSVFVLQRGNYTST
jgi:hypothetical protein